MIICILIMYDFTDDFLSLILYFSHQTIVTTLTSIVTTSTSKVTTLTSLETKVLSVFVDVDLFHIITRHENYDLVLVL